MNQNINTIVFAGASVGGLSYFGALQALEDNYVLNNIDTWIGCSSGSLACFISLLGIKGKQIFELLINKPEYKKMFAPISKSDIGLIAIINLLFRYGFVDISKLIKIIVKVIKEFRPDFDENMTFEELYELTRKEFVVTVSDISTAEVFYINHRNNPKFKVLEAIKYSCALPIVFRPIKIDSNTRMMVDGGCINCYPLEITDSIYEVNPGVLGFVTSINDKWVGSSYPTNLVDYISGIMNCFYRKVFELQSSQHGFYERSVILDVGNTSISTELTNDKITELYNLGYDNTITKLNNYRAIENDYSYTDYKLSILFKDNANEYMNVKK